MKNNLKRIISLLLVPALCLGLSCCSKKTGSSEDISESAPAKPEAELTEENVEAAEETSEGFDINQFVDYLNDSKYMMEFAQRFFEDYIIYTGSDGNFTYEPVDTSLPMSDYDWDNLTYGEDKTDLVYIEDGKIASMKGIDVSQYQGTIDWEAVAASGIEFAMLRVGLRGYGSEGNIRLDTEFENNVQGALTAGIPVGVYFITQATSVDEAIEEAEFVLTAIAPYKISFPVVLDVEEAASASARTALLTAKQRTDYVIAFCETIKGDGYTPMIYTNIRWFMEKLELERLTEYDKWFAQYFNRPFFPYEFNMWQYTNKGHIDGIEGDVDFNLCFCDYADK